MMIDQLDKSVAEPTVLVVDDEKNLRNLLRRSLQREGYGVIEAEDGGAALSLARRHLPDLILLDITMPELRGFAVCEGLQRDDSTRDIPVIILSAKDGVDGARRGLSLGARDYIAKPFDIELLLPKVRNLVERRVAEEAVRHSVARYRNLFEHAIDAIAIHEIVLDDAGKPVDYVYLDANPAFEEHTDLCIRDVIGKRATEIHPGIEETGLIQTYGKVALTGEPVSFERHFEPSKKHYQIHAYRVGKNRFAVNFIEITARKRIEEALRENEEKYRASFENARDAVNVFTTAGKILDANAELTRLSGYSRDELTTMTLKDLYPHAGGPETKKRIQALLAGEVIPVFESVLLTKSKAKVPVEIGVTAMRGCYGEEVVLQGNVRDITERKRAEEVQRENEMRFSLLFDSSHDLITVADSNAETLIANAAWRETLGYSPESQGDPIEKIHPDDRPRVLAAFGQMRNKGAEITNLEYRYRTANGAYVVLETTVRGIEWQGRSLLFTVSHNITERRRTEEELQKTHRLESLGVLAGGIAHDFNNLLGGMFGNIDMAKDAGGQNPEVDKYLDRALTAFSRARDLTGQLLTFSKGGVPSKSTISLERLLDESRSLALSGSNIQCETKISRKLGTVEADESQLSQVINNLLLNARQAMPGGGTITVTARNRTLRPNQIHGLKAGRHVQVSVQDSGTGIPDALLSKVFDPFFTTKDAGSGLGLATCHSIMRKHDGAITIDSQIGAGTTVHLFLPASDGEAAVKAKEIASRPGKGGRVLVMDDEEVMREVAQGMLELLGFDVVSTRDGEEAVKVFKKCHGTEEAFDLVLLDLTVPGGMGGEDAMSQICLHQPDITGIVASGYHDSPVLSNPAKYGFAAKIEKPYRKNELGRILDEVLTQVRQK